MTNAERIRQMTDEELAEMYDKLIQDCEYCPLYDETCRDSFSNVACKYLFLRWLQKEAET